MNTLHKIFWPFRVTLFYIIIAISAIICCLAMCIGIILPFKIRYLFGNLFAKIFIFSAKNICGINYKINGLKNIPKKQPFVICANHQSSWETFFLQSILPNHSTIFKKELLMIPFFGWGLALTRPIIIDRNNKLATKKIISDAVKQLANELRPVLVYPEGTRVAPHVNKKFSRSFAAIAINANVPVLPIAHDAGTIWPRGPWIKNPGDITVSISKPVSPNGHDSQSLTKIVETWIKQNQYQQGSYPK